MNTKITQTTIRKNMYVYILKEWLIISKKKRNILYLHVQGGTENWKAHYNIIC